MSEYKVNVCVFYCVKLKTLFLNLWVQCVGVALGVRARKCVEDARKAVARMINVKSSGKGYQKPALGKGCQ